MKTIDWVEVTQEELDRWLTARLEAMPAELRNSCDYCGAGVGGWCVTRNGEWARWSHKKRVELVN